MAPEISSVLRASLAIIALILICHHLPHAYFSTPEEGAFRVEDARLSAMKIRNYSKVHFLSLLPGRSAHLNQSKKKKIQPKNPPLSLTLSAHCHYNSDGDGFHQTRKSCTTGIGWLYVVLYFSDC